MSDVRDYTLPSDHVVFRWQRLALIVGALALGLSGLGAATNLTQFFRSYLFAYLFWFGLAMGCLAILMIYHITGGAWGAVIRRSLESATRTFPLLALLFVPIALGVHSLYEWADPAHVAHDALLQHKSPYLNVPFFLGRAVFYFVVWNVLIVFLNRLSLQQDQTTGEKPLQQLENLSRGGLVATGLTFTFAAVDWAMSLEPHWYSTLYGVLVVGGCLLSAMSFMVLCAAVLSLHGPLTGVIQKSQFHDLGKLMFAYIMLWAYFSLSQLLIMWSANLPEEIPWYLKRLGGGWEYVGILLILFHFVLPFLLLLSVDVKRNARLLAPVALFVLCIRAVEVFWLITPAFSPDRLSVHWMDLTALLGVGGIWIWAFIGQLKRRPLIAINDPSLPMAEHA
jgi:hypothetical protein